MIAKKNIHELALGDLTRDDGNRFVISALFYELATEYDYWLINYDAEHKVWGHMRFALVIPKRVAPTMALAMAIVNNSALEHIHSALHHATEGGRPLAPVFSDDGWILT